MYRRIQRAKREDFPMKTAGLYFLAAVLFLYCTVASLLALEKAEESAARSGKDETRDDIPRDAANTTA